MDARYQSFFTSYIQYMHDITRIDGHRFSEKLMISWIFESEMRVFYGLDKFVMVLPDLQKILENQYLDEMVALLQEIDDLFI